MDKKECATALDRLKANSIDKIALTIHINGTEGADFPCECTLGDDPSFGGICGHHLYLQAAGTAHKPLYFEDVQLERYGHTWNPADAEHSVRSPLLRHVALFPITWA